LRTSTAQIGALKVRARPVKKGCERQLVPPGKGLRGEKKSLRKNGHQKGGPRAVQVFVKNQCSPLGGNRKVQVKGRLHN